MTARSSEPTEPIRTDEPDAGSTGEPPRPNLLDRTLDRIDAFQRRVPPLAVIHGVVKKFGDDRAGHLATLLAYKGFFAVFPLLLAFVATVGLVLAGNDELRADLVDSTLASVPVIGAEISRNADEVDGSVTVVVVSVAVSLWAGLGLLEMIQEALHTVWDVPVYRRPPFLVRKLRSLPAAVLIGACLVLSGASAWAFGGAGVPLVQRVAAWVLPFLAGALAYLGLHWLLCRRKVPFVDQLPGAALMGLSWAVLQVVAGWYIDRFVLQSSDTYGVFVVVFGLLSWAYLIALAYLYANELCAVLWDRRWPRSMTGRNLTDEDRDAQTELLAREVRVEGVELDVEVPRLPR